MADPGACAAQAVRVMAFRRVPVETEVALGLNGLVCLVAPITDCRDMLTPAEALSVARAVTKRQEEYATGRWLARRALARFGLADSELLTAGDRQPRWPAAVAGSIAHASGYVSVAVGARHDYRAIGIDMERAGRVGAELVHDLLTVAERRRYRDLDATLVFSAKEACYKLLYPLYGEFIGFHDVEIDLTAGASVAQGVFRARYIGPAVRHCIVHQACGSYRYLGDCWLTCLTLAACRT